MKEAVICFYILILQMNVVAITVGILTYIRYTKESLRIFILIYISLQLIEIALLFRACGLYANHETTLLRGIISCLDVFGTTGLLFALTVFPFFIVGRKPGRWVKVGAALAALGFVLFNFIYQINRPTPWHLLPKIISAAILLTALLLILAALRNIKKSIRMRALGYLLCLAVILLPLVCGEPHRTGLLLFRGFWFAKPVALPFFLFVLNCGGLLLIKTYFAVPFYVDPENGKLSEYFTAKFNITVREEEIILLLRQGKAYKEIAADLTIAYKTVDAHIQNIYSKTGVNSRKQLVNLIETSTI